MKAETLQKLVLIGGVACLFPSCITSMWSRKPEPPMIHKKTVAPVPAPGSFAASPDDASERPIVTPIEDPKPTSPPPAPPAAKPAASIPTARPIPGREGVVFSPFNNKPVDVKGFASGTLVADPTYPPAEKKYFRVP